MRALLRRPRQALNRVIVAGNVALDTTQFTLSIDGAPVDMPRSEVMVLEVLMRTHGRLVSRRSLEDAVYPFDAEVTPNAIEAAISRVRKRLECNGATVAVTAMRGLGYILADKAA